MNNENIHTILDNGECPLCLGSWIGEEIIEHLRKHSFPKSEEALKEWASLFGWTDENKKTLRENVIAQQKYDEDWISSLQCLHCKNIIQ